MNIMSELVLIESKSARDGQLFNRTHEQAEDCLSKAKALLYFAMYQGSKIASTEQIAEFYEVPVDTIRKAYGRHKDELVSDGVTELKGKALKALIGIGHDSLSLPSSVTRFMSWTPRGALRLGMLLRDSEVAKAVRTVLLDATDSAARQSEELEILHASIRLEELRGANMARLNLLANTHGIPLTLTLLGRGDEVVEVEKQVLEVVDERHKVRFNGQTTAQIAEYVKKRHGIRLKNGGCVKRILKQHEKDHLIAHVPRVVIGEYIPNEHLQEVYKILTHGDRQMLIGE